MPQNNNLGIFDKIIKEAEKERIVPSRQRDSITWFRERSQSFVEISSQDITKDYSSRQVSVPSSGNLYHFYYMPKYKNKLPYYDIFPLVFVTGSTGEGFGGLNMHYLPPQLRATVMDDLYTLANQTELSESTRLNLSYQVLKGAANFASAKPAFKKYLFSFMKTSLIPIKATEWEIALFLPTARWRKATSDTVFSDTLNKIK